MTSQGQRSTGHTEDIFAVLIGSVYSKERPPKTASNLLRQSTTHCDHSFSPLSWKNVQHIFGLSSAIHMRASSASTCHNP